MSAAAGGARRRFDQALTALLAGCALAVATVAVHREFFPGTAPIPVRPIAGWRALAAGRAPALGDARARARIVLFSDFQCPYCRDLDRKLESALASLGGHVAVVRYDLPLTRIHAHAYPAARASRCAARQGAGRRFDALLFARDLDARGIGFPQLAREAGVPDPAAFRACLDDPRVSRAVDADMAVAHRLGIEGVPAMIVGGRLYSGTMESGALRDLLSSAP